jgi:hydroxymethylpyrimidine/phosphomethylpyrimidine kinase
MATRAALIALRTAVGLTPRVATPHRRPVALAIAGSDSGGGAGVQADLRTFAALGVHGVCAVTCLTAQNPRRVIAVEPSSAAMLRAQLQAVFEELPPCVAKTGMLCNAALVTEVVRWFRQHPRVPIVVDPVLVSTSGRRLLDAEGERVLRENLLPLATLVTPNAAEAARLAGVRVRTLDDLQHAAQLLHERHGCAVLAKGGHLRDGDECTDVLAWGKHTAFLTGARVRRTRTHGTGCTLSAALAAWLARGATLELAARNAKAFVTRAIAGSLRTGSHLVLRW